MVHRYSLLSKIGVHGKEGSGGKRGEAPRVVLWCGCLACLIAKPGSFPHGNLSHQPL